jgi:putative transposase
LHEQVRAQLHVSECRASAALGRHRSTQRKAPRGRNDEERLTADIIELALQYGRYGYRRIGGLLRQADWAINDKRVERIWRREGLKLTCQLDYSVGADHPDTRPLGLSKK